MTAELDLDAIQERLSTASPGAPAWTMFGDTQDLIFEVERLRLAVRALQNQIGPGRGGSTGETNRSCLGRAAVSTMSD